MTDHGTTISQAVSMLNRGDVDGYVTTLYSPDAVFHGFPDAFAPDREGIRLFFTALIKAVPDTTITPQDMVVDGDGVAIRFTLTGTHQGELMGAPGTGGPLEVEGMTFLRFADGLCVERWNQLDNVTLTTQLHALPPLVTA